MMIMLNWPAIVKNISLRTGWVDRVETVHSMHLLPRHPPAQRLENAEGVARIVHVLHLNLQLSTIIASSSAS